VSTVWKRHQCNQKRTRHGHQRFVLEGFLVSVDDPAIG
jgi:hypothetical protein